MGFGETLSFQQMVKHLCTEGRCLSPPNRPCALRLFRITFSGVITPVGGATAAKAEALHAEAQKRALRKYFEDFL